MCTELSYLTSSIDTDQQAFTSVGGGARWCAGGGAVFFPLCQLSFLLLTRSKPCFPLRQRKKQIHTTAFFCQLVLWTNFLFFSLLNLFLHHFLLNKKTPYPSTYHLVGPLRGIKCLTILYVWCSINWQAVEFLENWPICVSLVTTGSIILNPSEQAHNKQPPCTFVYTDVRTQVYTRMWRWPGIKDGVGGRGVPDNFMGVAKWVSATFYWSFGTPLVNN